MKLSSAIIKKENKSRILRYILKHPGITRPELSAELKLSLPTVGQIVSELVEEQIVSESGMQKSNGGRRAVTMSANPNYRLAFGVNITSNHVGMVLINLQGEILGKNRVYLPFVYTDEYMRKMDEILKEFLSRFEIGAEQLLGTGVSIPGIISSDQKYLVVSHALSVAKPLALSRFPFDKTRPVYFFNDATAGCMAELYTEKVPSDFNFISLNNTVGGAAVMHGEIIPGMNNRNGEIGHMCIVPNGRMCYCGKKGHYDAYAAAVLLAEKSRGGTVEDFFDELENDEELQAFFEEYLHYLSLMVYNLHMQSDLPVLVGGYVGNFLEKYAERIEDEIREMTIFEEKESYLYLSNYGVEGCAVGASRYLIEKFLEHCE